SQTPPSGRATPRASVLGQAALSPASIAGLPRRARVATGPPLSRRTPSSASVLTRSPGWLKLQVFPLSRLCPAEIAGKANEGRLQFSGLFPCSMVFLSVTDGFPYQ